MPALSLHFLTQTSSEICLSETSNGPFLSNGWTKLDFLLHLEVKRWETDILSLLMNRLSMGKAEFEGSDLPVALSEIMQLLCEWVTFSVGDISVSRLFLIK